MAVVGLHSCMPAGNGDAKLFKFCMHLLGKEIKCKSLEHLNYQIYGNLSLPVEGTFYIPDYQVLPSVIPCPYQNHRRWDSQMQASLKETAIIIQLINLSKKCIYKY